MSSILAGSDTPSPPPDSIASRLEQLLPTNVIDCIDISLWNNQPDFDPTTETSPTKVSTKIAYYAYCYVKDGLRGKALFSAFKTDFEEWSEPTIHAAPSTVRVYLRNYLLYHGVYIESSKFSKISQMLKAVADRDDFPLWTREQIQQIASRSSDFDDAIQDPNPRPDTIAKEPYRLSKAI
ncbi:glycosyl transferase [Colletotrichum musicola]|uniref:Glycosyl transferase n=1 Tax=Colletotrichum musicola TaxID=2175873 RepID=A0A8H6IRD0_9PEZI|nr:glycosyl transferase [Colletotrichum musicola]